MELDVADRIQLTISFILKATLVIAIGSALYRQNWIAFFVASVTLILSFLPAVVEKNYQIYLPVEFELIILVFIYATLFLGELHGYYTRFWWWDIMLHSFAGLAFGFLGFLILYILYAEDKIRTSPVLIAVFSFCFAVAIGSLWEIFEFSVDTTLGLNMQKSGLLDTMADISVNAISALVVATGGYFYIKKGGFLLFNRLVEKFIKENPRMFKKMKKRK